MSKSKVRIDQHLRQHQVSEQQIRLLDMLRLSGTELADKIDSEIEENPALEEEVSQEEVIEQLDDRSTSHSAFSYSDTERTFDLNRIASHQSAQEQLRNQLGFLSLPGIEQHIGEQIIGNLDGDGYLRRPLEAVVNDLQKVAIQVDVAKVEAVLSKIQRLEPGGIAARNLQECLLLQLEQIDEAEPVIIARRVVSDYYEALSKRHFAQITHKLSCSEAMMKDALRLISRLNPKPGGAVAGNEHVIRRQLPDFIVTIENDQVMVHLQNQPLKKMHVSRSYLNMLRAVQTKKDVRNQETLAFIQQKIASAKWFKQAIFQREQTLLSTARIIVQKQMPFFLSGDPMKLAPLVLQDVATPLGVGVSTVSRIVNNKRIETAFGVFLLRYFFAQGIPKQDKAQVSSRSVKTLLEQFIQKEDKKHPFSDERLQSMLKEKGFVIARRTVAKYRELLRLPVARLRKAW